ncbi:unnamed protein product [Rotaria sordida]|uniref:Uncharacterized protein n=1 Tax=Rotaria sordida TaxID=392033 RepID=A0A815LK98_9BILA|nr:unnamed protein product [Rotaria sordida]
MQYEPGTDKVAMMDTPYVPTTRPLALAEDPQVQRPRKVLLIMLGICLGLSLFNTIIVIVDRTRNPQESGRLSQPLLSILFYSFGLFVTYKYHQTGLRVFAWLGVIMLICTGIVFGLILIGALASLALISVFSVAVNSIDYFHFYNNYD